MLENSGSLNIFVVLSIGLLFGLKHATEVDHVVAISTIVSRHQNVFRSAIVGALWGAGHTVSLLVMGAIVLSLRVTIPETVSNWLEFGVAVILPDSSEEESGRIVHLAGLLALAEQIDLFLHIVNHHRKHLC